MVRWIRCLIALMVLCGLTVTTRASDETDVKEAAKAFANALSKGDADQAKQHATSDEVTVAIIVNLSPLVVASNRLHDAAVAKFGKDGEDLAPNPAANMSEWSKSADQSLAKVAGDVAMLTPKPEPSTRPVAPQDQPQPLRFKKEGGQWKVDLSAMSTPAQMKQTAPRYKAVAEAMNSTAQQITEGKFKDAKIAALALQQNVNAAVQRAAPAGAGGRSGQ